jgi:hypothetical protein
MMVTLEDRIEHPSDEKMDVEGLEAFIGGES